MISEERKAFVRAKDKRDEEILEKIQEICHGQDWRTESERWGVWFFGDMPGCAVIEEVSDDEFEASISMWPVPARSFSSPTKAAGYLLPYVNYILESVEEVEVMVESDSRDLS